MSNARAEWITTTFGAIFDQRRELARGGETLLSVTVDRGVISQGEAGRRNISSEDKSLYKRVNRGDIVYNTMRMWQGVSGVAHINGIVSPAYTVCAPKDGFDSGYLSWLLKYPPHVVLFRAYSQGLVSDTWNLKFATFASLPVRVPRSEGEQWRIAEVLEAIDDQIEVVRSIITKRDKIRAGLLRDTLRVLSMVEPPSGWLRLPLGELVPSVDYGISHTLTEENTGIPVLRMNNVGEGRAGFGEFKYCSEKVSRELILGYGDVLFNRTNSLEQVGRSGMWRDELPEATFASYLVRLNVNQARLAPEYLALWLSHPLTRQRVRAISTPAVQQVNVNPTKLRALSIDLPSSLDEQRRITALLDDADTQIVREQAELEKLRLLKAGLMEDLLTGRVRVTRGGELTG